MEALLLIVGGYFVIAIILAVLVILLWLLTKIGMRIKELWESHQRKNRIYVILGIIIGSIASGLTYCEIFEESSSEFWNVCGFSLGVILFIAIHAHQLAKGIREKLNE